MSDQLHVTASSSPADSRAGMDMTVAKRKIPTAAGNRTQIVQPVVGHWATLLTYDKPPKKLTNVMLRSQLEPSTHLEDFIIWRPSEQTSTRIQCFTQKL
jgi:hypothetical protein